MKLAFGKNSMQNGQNFQTNSFHLIIYLNNMTLHTFNPSPDHLLFTQLCFPDRMNITSGCSKLYAKWTIDTDQ